MKILKKYQEFLNENVDTTTIANQIKAELEKKGLKGVFGNGIEPKKVLEDGIGFVVSLEKQAWGIGKSVYLQNTPENIIIAKDIYNKNGGDYSQSFENGKVIGVTNIGYKIETTTTDDAPAPVAQAQVQPASAKPAPSQPAQAQPVQNPSNVKAS